jgi:hypothetical protein
MEEFNCCICKRDTYGWGNNPEPVRATTKNGMDLIDERGLPIRCCDLCNITFVKPTRIRIAKNIK